MEAVETINAVSHPLEPLSADEVAAAAAILKRDRSLAADARFVTITIIEPPKADVLAFRPRDRVDRQAKIIIRERAKRSTYEGVVSITDNRTLSWNELPGVQPAIMFEEFLAVEEVVKQNLRFQEALRKRGVTDMSLVMCDPWSLGYNGPEDDPSKGRFCRPLSWVRSDPEDNGYARPIEGVVVRLDLDRMQVLEVEDHGVVPLPERAGNYTVERIRDPVNFPHFPEGTRADVKALEIKQPDGPSFAIEGHHVSWQKWDLRVGFTPREGLVLHMVQYRDGGRLRPIIYRASLSEMFIPYGDPQPTHYRKNVFDMGEYGVGVMSNSLELGCDCLGEIHYFDGVVNDNDGNALVLQKAICLHEEDFGILWKHTDFRTGKAEVRRSRRLVISSIATIGNYEYGYFWYLYQDGTIQYEVKLTGVISTGAIVPGVRPTYGVAVAPGVYGPNHQHFFNVRLDMMVDGVENSVDEVHSEAAPPGPENPHGNAWLNITTPLDHELIARRRIDPLSARRWRISNPSMRNELGEPVAYTLMPGDNIVPFYQPDAHALKRAQFTTHHLWVTAYDPSQMFAAGDYPNQNPEDKGLPAYQAADRPLANADAVVWYTFGAHHVPRPEDWPVMPAAYIGFHLKPTGFFMGNPALDNPIVDYCGPERVDHSAHHSH
ncbi:MAG TPA: primary-amine oxidase [Candidatus Dormibacteraeota bacterium]|nr:primary-amine oxidase [Candidatus Dormibacteraeota bacterium]